MNGRTGGQSAERLKGREAARGFVQFVSESPTAFHAVSAARKRLDAASFTYLPENTDWSDAVKPGRGYYTVRNNSSLVAWKVGSELDSYHFQMAAAHADSPTFKLKDHAEVEDGNGYVHLDVEPYGGPIDYSWFDRPLTIAGRVLVRTGLCVSSRLVALDRDVAIIPSVAIHLNRGANEGFSPNPAVDICPIVAAGDTHAGTFTERLAETLNVEPDQILAHDLYLVNRQKPSIWGSSSEFLSAPRLDDLLSAYVALEGFLSSDNEHCITVFSFFDNEEVGSGTAQGARSTFLSDVLVRVNAALGRSETDLLRALASSMLVSCDCAHAVHPAHPELSDPDNAPHLNGGLVIKESGSQRYYSDAFCRAVFRDVLDSAGLPYQVYANRSDIKGGVTLAGLLTQQVSVHTIDVGCPQLAMHSAYETGGTYDVDLASRALGAYYAADIQISGADAALVQ